MTCYGLDNKNNNGSSSVRPITFKELEIENNREKLKMQNNILQKHASLSYILKSDSSYTNLHNMSENEKKSAILLMLIKQGYPLYLIEEYKDAVGCNIDFDRIDIPKSGMQPNIHPDYTAIICKNNKYGLYNIFGDKKMITDIIYDDIKWVDGIIFKAHLNGNLILLKFNGRNYNLSGYDDIKLLVEDGGLYIFKIYKNGKCALYVINEIITGFQYDDIKAIPYDNKSFSETNVLSSDYMSVMKNGNYALFDRKKQKEVTGFEYKDFYISRTYVKDLFGDYYKTTIYGEKNNNWIEVLVIKGKAIKNNHWL